MGERERDYVTTHELMTRAQFDDAMASLDKALEAAQPDGDPRTAILRRVIETTQRCLTREWEDVAAFTRIGIALGLNGDDVTPEQILAHIRRAPAPASGERERCECDEAGVARSECITYGCQYPAPAEAVALRGAICPTHGLAVLVTHVDDDQPCTDYLFAHPAPARGEAVTEEMVIDAKMALEGWAGDSHRYACMSLLRAGDRGMLGLQRALIAALARPDRERGT